MLSVAVAALITFHDLPKTSWAYPDVVLLASAGTLHGERSGLFLPTGTVSREQAAATLARVLKLPTAPLPAFKDRQEVSPTLAADVAGAAAAGVIEGTATGYLAPRAPLTRAQAAALIARAFAITPSGAPLSFHDAADIPAYARGDVAALVAAGVALGDAQGNFEPQRRVTRAEWAALLLRAVIAHGGAPGVPSLAAGSVATIDPPNDPSLAAESPLGGANGAVEIGGQTLSLADGALVYRQGAAVDFFGIGQGDLAAAWIGPDGSVALVEDLKAPAKDPSQGVIADVSPDAIYMDSGAEFTGPAASVSYGGETLRVGSLPDYLLWSKATVETSGSGLVVQVAEPYAIDLQGTIEAAADGALTLRLTASSALSPLVPALAAGSTAQIETSTNTEIAGVGANPPQTPAIGQSAQVMGYYVGDAVAADRVILSQ